MAAAKICLLLCATGAQYYAMTPPNTRPSSKERLNPTGLEVITPWIHILVKIFIGVCVLSDIILAYAARKESTVISKSLMSLLVRSDLCSLSNLDHTVSSPALIAGSCLSVIGSAIRIHCYSTLGRLFTFELSIRQNHKLVTSGPYSIVRHPSYAGGLCVFLGILLCHFHTRSWLVSCSGVFPSSDQGVKLTLGGVLVCLFSLLFSGLEGRIQKEEAMLQGNFGDQWTSYVKRVPYRLVPWLF
jgi:protein-S-isoprenylcysteine O-methyltransferase Ste14